MKLLIMIARGANISAPLLIICAGLFYQDSALARAPIGLSHIHGIAIHAEEPSNLVLGTHRGIYSISTSNESRSLSVNADDFMALVQHPLDLKILFASGHPQSGGNLGLLRSSDGGKSWEKISAGADSNADFHLLTVNPANPDRLFGQFKVLRRSLDGGKTWKSSGTLPEKTIDIAASAIAAERLYAGTETGLYRSNDSGNSWQQMSSHRLPVSTVLVTNRSQMFVFIVGIGLMVADENNPTFSLLTNSFGLRVPMKIVQNPSDRQLMYALDNRGSIWSSSDGGKNWDYFIASTHTPTKSELSGQSLYSKYCVSCHGREGVGENYTVESLTSKDYIMAPPLDYSAHAWHHTDEQLGELIQKGSPRTKRMPAWGLLFSDLDVQDVVAYMKTLWTARELECQGPKHMECM